MISLMKTHPLIKIASSALIYLPCPSNITSLWNLGSLLALCLGVQLMSGLLLSMHYASDVSLAFSSVSHISRDVEFGWLFRMFHANGASFFFICLYSHIARGLYYGSYFFELTWMAGSTIFILVMAAAFLGYVLPWGQMSFWGATVITNLFSAIPMIGGDIVFWLWGGFAVDNATLTRFFALHFLVPFIVAALTMVHLLFLHQTGSNNPLGTNSNFDKLAFHPYFTFKDLFGACILFLGLLSLSLLAPWLLGDPENFLPANPLVTPVHIQPEWYFLFAYAILRSIPNKLGGVVALALSVAVLYVIPFINYELFRGVTFYPLSKATFWCLVVVLLLLTWIGARPVEDPYIITGQILTCLYFGLFGLSSVLSKLWDNKYYL